MSTAQNPVQKLYALFVRIASSLQSPLLLVIRVYWGWQHLAERVGKASQSPARRQNFSRASAFRRPGHCGFCLDF